MTSKHSITCIALSAAVVLKLFAGTVNAAVLNGGIATVNGAIVNSQVT